MFDVIFVTHHRDSRSFRLAYRTVAQGLRGAGRIMAVVPDAEVPFFEHLSLGVTLVPESRLDPRFAALPGGWWKQQLLKLCVHAVMERPAALILDSDTYLCRPVDAASFQVSGKTPFYVEDEQGRAHPAWRAAAEATLAHVSIAQRSYFPTPNFMHRDALAALHEHLGDLWGTDPVEGLMERMGQYTEWALYGLFIDEIMGERSPHALCGVDHVLGLWERSELDAWEPQRAAPIDAPPLVIVQSAIGATWPEIITKLRHLPHVAGCLAPEEVAIHG